jgi:DNA-binding transcriptional ArsR family regulator
MDVTGRADIAASKIAAAIGEPARARMLYCLMDGHARTATELAVVAGVSPSTASVHLNRLRSQRLITLFSQGKHRYFSLEGPNVARALEALHVVAGGSRKKFVPNTPNRLLAARTCYDHIAGTLGVQLHDRLKFLGWLSETSKAKTSAQRSHKKEDRNYDLTPQGTESLASLGIDVEAARSQRRRFACACLDWSERRPHLAGSIAAALLQLALKRRWLEQDLDSRALSVTSLGRRELHSRLGLTL